MNVTITDAPTVIYPCNGKPHVWHELRQGGWVCFRCGEVHGSNIRVKTFEFNGRFWQIVKIGQSYFARDDQGSDTGPYHHPEWAEEWVRGIR